MSADRRLKECPYCMAGEGPCVAHGGTEDMKQEAARNRSSNQRLQRIRAEAIKNMATGTYYPIDPGDVHYLLSLIDKDGPAVETPDALDAARYRWLRDYARTQGNDTLCCWAGPPWDQSSVVLWGWKLDNNIDARMGTAVKTSCVHRYPTLVGNSTCDFCGEWRFPITRPAPAPNKTTIQEGEKPCSSSPAASVKCS